MIIIVTAIMAGKWPNWWPSQTFWIVATVVAHDVVLAAAMNLCCRVVHDRRGASVTKRNIIAPGPVTASVRKENPLPSHTSIIALPGVAEAFTAVYVALIGVNVGKPVQGSRTGLKGTGPQRLRIGLGAPNPLIELGLCVGTVQSKTHPIGHVGKSSHSFWIAKQRMTHSWLISLLCGSRVVPAATALIIETVVVPAATALMTETDSTVTTSTTTNLETNTDWAAHVLQILQSSHSGLAPNLEQKNSSQFVGYDGSFLAYSLGPVMQSCPVPFLLKTLTTRPPTSSAWAVNCHHLFLALSIPSRAQQV